MKAALTALALLGAAACTAPPARGLVVRHPERKCALVKFAFCSQFATFTSQEDEADAGSD